MIIIGSKEVNWTIRRYTTLVAGHTRQDDAVWAPHVVDLPGSDVTSMPVFHGAVTFGFGKTVRLYDDEGVPVEYVFRPTLPLHILRSLSDPASGVTWRGDRVYADWTFRKMHENSIAIDLALPSRFTRFDAPYRENILVEIERHATKKRP